MVSCVGIPYSRLISLSKVFLSIKGVYFQAEIQDQPVTWIVPYQFCQEVIIEAFSIVTILSCNFLFFLSSIVDLCLNKLKKGELFNFQK